MKPSYYFYSIFVASIFYSCIDGKSITTSFIENKTNSTIIFKMYLGGVLKEQKEIKSLQKLKVGESSGKGKSFYAGADNSFISGDSVILIYNKTEYFISNSSLSKVENIINFDDARNPFNGKNYAKIVKLNETKRSLKAEATLVYENKMFE